MRKPTIHLNGTSREALLEGYVTAISAVNDAMAKLAAAAPNGRDYYPQGTGALTEAQQEHEARAAKLRSVAAELQEIAEALV